MISIGSSISFSKQEFGKILFRHGYYRGHTNTHVTIDIPKCTLFKKEISDIPINNVLYKNRPFLQKVKCPKSVATVHPVVSHTVQPVVSHTVQPVVSHTVSHTVQPAVSHTVPTLDSVYVKRKEKENAILISDMFEEIPYLKIEEANILALDDFEKNSTKLRTLSTWLQSGGVAQRVYIPNKDSDEIVKAARAIGAQSHRVTFGEYVKHPRKYKLPRFDVIYADYCGWWSSHSSDFDDLFKNHNELLSDKVILHITTSKREIGGREVVASEIFNALTINASTYGYGKVLQLHPPYGSSEMTKTFFLLKRNKKRTRDFR